MALAHTLVQEGHAPEQPSVSAAATFDQVGDGFKVTKINLTVRGRVPGVDEATFRAAAEEGCPISRALKGNVAMTVEATLES